VLKENILVLTVEEELANEVLNWKYSIKELELLNDVLNENIVVAVEELEKEVLKEKICTYVLLGASVVK